MKEKILALLKDSGGRALTTDEFIDKLKLNTKDDIKTFVEELNKLCEDGEVYYTKKNKYILFEDSHMLKGTIMITASGNGFVKVEGYDKDIFIDKRDLNGAIEKDLVALELNRSNLKEGKIIKILNRDIEDIVGEFYILNGKNYVKKLGEKESKNDIMIPDDYTNGAVPGHYVLVKPFKDQKSYIGEVVRITGHKNNAGDDTLAYIYKHKFHHGFSKGIEEELKHIPSYLTEEIIAKELAKGRVDLRDEEIFTIDGDDTKDIDDAVSYKKLANGNHCLTVSIADVSYYVKEGSEIDKEAYARATSIYFPGGAEPMLPPKLSNGICSLNPETDRLAFTCKMEINDKGEIVDYDIFESIIRSRIQMTYKKVNDILDNNIVAPGYEKYVNTLVNMNNLAEILRNKMISRGYIEFETDECKIIVDDNCVPIEIQRRTQGTGEKIIEVYMIAANETVAYNNYCRDLPSIYRVHDIPKEEKFTKFIKFLSSRGIIITGIKRKNKDITPQDFQKIVSIINENKSSAVLNKMAIRTQRKAEYSDYNIGHFGLGSKCYSHFTSPIRRYPDLTLHRLTKDYLYNISKEVVEKWETNLPSIAVHCSEREKAAEEFERDVDKMRKAEYMEKHIGEEYQGLISGVHEFGIFIELDNTVEGLAKIENLPKDSYEYNEESLTLRGKKQENTFTFGNVVTVKVIGASKEAQTVDFMIINKNNKDKLEKPKIKKRIKGYEEKEEKKYN